MHYVKSYKSLTLLAGLFFSLTGPLSLAQSTGLPQPELITDRQGLPQGFVPGIVQDRQGFIWMATHDGLCRYDGNQFKVFRAKTTGRSAVPFSNIASLQLDHLGRIWMTSEQRELALFDPRTELFTNISRQLSSHLSLFQLGIMYSYPDRQNRLWMTSDNTGLVCYDLTTRRVRWFRHQANQPRSLISDRPRCVLQDQQGTIWIGTDDAGLERFEEKTEDFTHYRPDSQTPLALPELTIRNLYQRPSGEILLGTNHYVCQLNPKTDQFHAYRLPAENPDYPDHYRWGMHFATDSRGVTYCDQRDRLFRFTDREGLQLLTCFTPQTGFCSSLFIDRSDVLWMGTDGSGVRKYDLRADGFRIAQYQAGFQEDVFTQWLHIPPTLTKSTQNTDSYMFRYTLDRQGKLWINVGSSTMYHINPITRQYERIDFPIPFSETISPMATDEQGQVWVLYAYNLWSYNSGSRRWTRSTYHVDQERIGEIVQIVADQQAFWLASQNQGLFRLDRRTGQLRQYSHQLNQPSSLNNNSLYCLSADPADSNRLWIGTFGSGLCAFDKRSGQCRRITEQDGLPNDVIYSAIPDGHGNLWIGTNKGLCRLNRRTFQTRTYTTEDGLLANEFNRFHYLQLPGRGTATDEIIMGGVVGITSFQPAQLQDDSFQPNVALTDLQINNQLVQPGLDSPLHEPIQTVKELNLRHDQNFLTIQFAAIQYNRRGKNRYRYQLEGINQGWVESSEPRAVYTALAPGSYRLLVNASNTSGLWSPYVHKMAIRINPPFWRTGWAYGLYAVLLAGLIRLYVRYRLRAQRLELTAQLSEQEARQLRALDEVKSRFFANITHELRTPLTLILGPLERLKGLMPDPEPLRWLTTVERQARDLLGLINQLLDLAKLDTGLLPVHLSRGSIGQTLRELLAGFEDQARSQRIRLELIDQLADKEYWLDTDKLVRIVTNLVTNALRWTPPEGEVVVTLSHVAPPSAAPPNGPSMLSAPTPGVYLTISDTGVGIPADELPRLFERFYQVDNPPGSMPTEPGADSISTQPGHQGTGIGLALVEELAQLQQGWVRVESRQAGLLPFSTRFTVWLPYRLASESPASVGTESPEGDFRFPRPAEDQEAWAVLIVEDSPELADFIAESLPTHYVISRAADGVAGLKLATDSLPDLIISDVMMPGLDGFSLCQRLKSDPATNHIPLVLLTAKAAHQSRIQGLSVGADDYLTKPFGVDELRWRVHNLLLARQRQRDWVRKSLTQVDEPLLPPAQDPFLEQFYTVLDQALSQSSLSLDQLADELAVSVRTLQRKVAALTGMTAIELMRAYRLRQAARRLQSGQPVSAVAYEVGFENRSYFAKCFKEQFGLTPSEYATGSSLR